MSASDVMDTPATLRSTSPVKPEDEATEPKEAAKCGRVVPVPSPSTSDGDSKDGCSADSRDGEDSLPGASCLVTQKMVEEEEKMEEQGELEEQQRREEQSKLWETMDANDKEQRFQRLQYLLQRSNMYTQYLIDRMKRQQEEEAKRKERKARKIAKQEEKRREEEQRKAESGANEEGAHVKDEETVHGLRGRKRKAADDPVKKEPPAKAPTSKKRKVNRPSAPPQDSSDTAVEEEDDATQDEEMSSENSSPAGPEQMSTGPRMVDGEEIPEGQPSLMTGGVLRPYQLEGYQWLKTLYENGVNGILADEMGLGKTVQCVAMLAHMAYMGVPGPFLICAPLSTIPNWYSEFKRFAPKVPVMLYHGSKDERATLRGKMHRLHKVREGVKIQPCVITSYEVAMMDRRFLQQHDWRYLIVDEGHRIKNTHCRLISALRMYKTTNRLLLTGTPLQNNLAELWSLLNFLLPEIFDDLGSFEAWFDIEHIGDGSVCQQIAADEQRKSVLSMLHQILTPFMLRRLKTDVDLRIPPKKEVIVYAPLMPLQKEFYAALIDKTIFTKIQEKNGTQEVVETGTNGRPVRKAASVKVDYNLMIGSNRDEKECRTPRQKKHDEEELDDWVKAIVDMQQKRAAKSEPEQKVSQLTIKLRNVMMQLRKCCSHPFLLEHPLDPKTGELALDERIIAQSGKIMVLDRMLAELRKRGHKVLIFSQMTRMLDLLEDFCVLRKYEYCRLDGGMNIMDRKENMEEYQKAGSDKFVFLLSTRAGGLGINLTAADTVIIYDSDWNPQCDLQAQDRCHRIGQTRPVMVYRLVTANTIDQRIVERAAAKRKLEKLVIHQGKFKSGIKDFKTSLDPVSSEELLELLNSRDHESEVGGQAVISEAELEQLLDRSDLEVKWVAKKNKGETGVGSKSDEQSQSTSTPGKSTAKSGKSGKRSSVQGKTSRKSDGRKSSSDSQPTVPESTLFKVIDIDDGETSVPCDV